MAKIELRTNYSNGYVVEFLDVGKEPCESYILLPAENLWHDGVRGFLYCLALIYLFLGIAIVSDVFMSSIEVITSKKRTVVRWDDERQERVEREVLVWNETVANLTLMALGSSAPEILLAVIETVTNLDKIGNIDEQDDGLGTFTIIGSAAFNLLIITAVCIISVPTPEIKKIFELGVFVLTSIWSIFAYVWMLIVIQGISPGEVEIWEAWVTLAFFPLLVLMAYCQDNGWWCRKNSAVSDSQTATLMFTNNVRIVKAGDVTKLHGMPKQLTTLEKERERRISRASLFSHTGEKDADHLRDAEAGSVCSQSGLYSRRTSSAAPTVIHARARFRHAAVRSMLGGRVKPSQLKPKADVADVARVVKSPTKGDDRYALKIQQDLFGTFTFASQSYSVLESAGILEVDVLFHRSVPSKTPSNTAVQNGGAQANGGVKKSEKETSFSTGKPSHTGIVSVEYETREASAKYDDDFKFTSGTLVFKESEVRKTITIPIIKNDHYDADADFYILLKTTTGEASLGDPNITRVTIIDDDEPGEFQFKEPQYYADSKTGLITAEVIRQKGCDGTVTIEYSTIDGTATGGSQPGVDGDFARSTGSLLFNHGETSKCISIDINKSAKGSKNFIITLRNPSLGAKIGENSATVANLTADDLAQRIADALADDDEEDVTWGGQFKNAMVLETGRDEEGNEVPISWWMYLLHFLSFFWKVLFACIPPTSMLGSWPTFVISLLGIGACTALVEQIGNLLGCVVGLKASVAGITIVALGTSLPDTFASRTAALHDDGADAAIGNVTGSNSVNVFLGLGLPWVIGSLYAASKNVKYTVAKGNLVSSVIIFTICGTICIFLLLIRRRVVGGELGGTKCGQYSTALFLISLWILYVTLSAVKAYHPDALPW